MKYLFFDTETNGLPQSHPDPLQRFPRMLQLAWILKEDDKEPVEKSFFIVVDFDIKADAVAVHGIDREKLDAEGVPLQDVLNDFYKDLESADIIIGHNVNFDRQVVAYEFMRNAMTNAADLMSKKKMFCTMKTTTTFCNIPGLYGPKFPKLQELYKTLFKKEFQNGHNALHDIRATMECFFELQKRGIVDKVQE